VDRPHYLQFAALGRAGSQDRSKPFAVAGLDGGEREADVVPGRAAVAERFDPGDLDPASDAAPIEQEDLEVQRDALLRSLVGEDANAAE